MTFSPLALVLAAGAESHVVLDLIIVLGASAFAVLALSRLGVSAIPAPILTGALIGPHALGLVLTVPDAAVARGGAGVARRLRPDLWIAARAPLAAAAARLGEAGADLVLTGEDSVGQRLAEAVGRGVTAVLEARPEPGEPKG